MGMVDHVSDQALLESETFGRDRHRQTMDVNPTTHEQHMDDKRQTRVNRQTCVSRTGARHLESDGRGILMFGRCFMFQMFHAPPPSRARESPSHRDRALCKARCRPRSNPVELRSDRPKKAKHLKHEKCR
jgi:hypothetical protein